MLSSSKKHCFKSLSEMQDLLQRIQDRKDGSQFDAAAAHGILLSLVKMIEDEPTEDSAA
jgi:hypothetical protein